MDQESVFLITGGASRFGKAVAKLLLSEGACLTILDLRSPPDDLRRVPQSRLLYLQVDITTEKDVFNAIHATKLKFGKLNGVINCAEIRMKSPMFNKDSLQPLLSRTIDVNFFGSLNVIRAALPLIKHNKRNSYGEKGIVINTSSGLGVNGLSDFMVFSISKAAVIALTVPLSKELEDEGIRVLDIAPEVAGKKKAKRFALLVRTAIEDCTLNGTSMQLKSK